MQERLYNRQYPPQPHSPSSFVLPLERRKRERKRAISEFSRRERETERAETTTAVAGSLFPFLPSFVRSPTVFTLTTHE